MTVMETTTGGGATARPELTEVRERLRVATEATEGIRRSTAMVARLETELRLLRSRVPAVLAVVDRARREQRALAGTRPGVARYLLRGRLGPERERRAEVLRDALAQQRTLETRIAERRSEVTALQREAARLRSSAATLPRLFDEVAACLHRDGGTAAEELTAAEAGLEPVLRREAELDQAVRWAGWARVQVDRALDRLGPGRTFTEYDGYLGGATDCATDGTDTRAPAARATLSGVREVVSVLERSLADLGVAAEEVHPPELPDDLDVWFTHLDDPTGRIPGRVAQALADCERVTVQLVALRERLHADHTATVRVLQARRAQWCTILRGACAGPEPLPRPGPGSRWLRT